MFTSNILYGSDKDESEIRKNLDRLSPPIYINYSDFKPVQGIISIGIIDNNDVKFTFSIIDDQLNTILSKENSKIELQLRKNSQIAAMLLGIINKCIEMDYFQVLNYEFSKRKNFKKHASMFAKWMSKKQNNIRRKNWLIHRNRSLGYQIKYPESWERSRNIYSYIKEHKNKSKLKTKTFLSVNIADSNNLSLDDWLSLYQNKLINYDKGKNTEYFRHFVNEKLSYKIARKNAILQKTGIINSKGKFKKEPDSNWNRIYIRAKERIFIFELHNPHDSLDNKEFHKTTKKMLKSFKII